MQISEINFKLVDQPSWTRLRFTPGVGHLRSVVTVQGKPKELENISAFFEFLLTGKRFSSLEEAILELNDDSGNTWRIERSPNSAVFRCNDRLLTIDEAQRSLLASLLDLEASLIPKEGMVGPIEMHRLIKNGSSIAGIKYSSLDDFNRFENPFRRSAELIVEELKDSLPVNGTDILQGMQKIGNQASKLLKDYEESLDHLEKLTLSVDLEAVYRERLESDKDLKNFASLEEALQEVLLNQEQATKLGHELELVVSKIEELETKWEGVHLNLLSQEKDPFHILELRVHSKVWQQYAEILGRIKVAYESNILGSQQTAGQLLRDFLNGARTDGTEVENCLASILLSLKQATLELDRYTSQVDKNPGAQVASLQANRWYSKIFNDSAQVIRRQESDVSEPSILQRKFLEQLLQEIASVKVALEYAIHETQSLDQHLEDYHQLFRGELSLISETVSKAEAESRRRERSWNTLAEQMGLPLGLSLQKLTNVLIDGMTWEALIQSKVQLEDRLTRAFNQRGRLESLVREWWNRNGSQKDLDLSHMNLLITEAKAVLNYKDDRQTRRERLNAEIFQAEAQKRSMDFWVSRKQEVRDRWQQLVLDAGFPLLKIDHPSVIAIADSAAQCALLAGLAQRKDQEYFGTSFEDLLRTSAALSVYLWTDLELSPLLCQSFLESLEASIGQSGDMPILLLIAERSLSEELIQLGTGCALPILSDHREPGIQTPRSGAVHKKLRPSDVPFKSQEQKDEHKRPVVEEKKVSGTLLSPKAQEALRILAPKSTNKGIKTRS